MANIDVLKLPDYLKQQRWFAGKEHPIKRMSVLDQVTLTGHGAQGEVQFTLAIIEVVYELGTTQRYLLVVRISNDGRVSNALDDEALAQRLLDVILDGETLPTAGGVIRGEQASFAKPFLHQAKRPGRVHRLEVEQSNTSLVFDERVILKLIRKLEHGPNPELEIGQFLASRASFRAAPRLLGWIQLEGPMVATLAILQQFIRGATDGWNYVLEVLRRVGRPTPELLEEMGTLGRVIGELHLALASDPNHPVFAPEPIQQVDLQRWSSSIIGELGVTIAAAAKAIPSLAQRREALVDKIHALAQLRPSGQKIRLHGDLHLGQVLQSEQGWQVFDFEGEPSRSFNQRREKHSPLRDVAGMLRSFAYVVAVIELQGGKCEDCVPRCREAFLQGYLSIVRRTELLPASADDFSLMLEVLEIEKLLYEVRYELQNRPEWLGIPARTLMQMEG